MAVWGGLTNSCEKKRSKEQRREEYSLQASLKVDSYLFVENLQLWLFHQLQSYLFQLFCSLYFSSGLGKMAHFIKCLDLLTKLQYFYFFPLFTINSEGNYRKGGLSGILFSTFFNTSLCLVTVQYLMNTHTRDKFLSFSSKQSQRIHLIALSRIEVHSAGKHSGSPSQGFQLALHVVLGTPRNCEEDHFSRKSDKGSSCGNLGYVLQTHSFCSKLTQGSNQKGLWIPGMQVQ